MLESQTCGKLSVSVLNPECLRQEAGGEEEEEVLLSFSAVRKLLR